MSVARPAPPPRGLGLGGVALIIVLTVIALIASFIGVASILAVLAPIGWRLAVAGSVAVVLALVLPLPLAVQVSRVLRGREVKPLAATAAGFAAFVLAEVLVTAMVVAGFGRTSVEIVEAGRRALARASESALARLDRMSVELGGSGPRGGGAGLALGSGGRPTSSVSSTVALSKLGLDEPAAPKPPGALEALGAPPPYAHDGDVSWVAFSKNGETLYTAGTDGTARVWDLVAGVQRNRVTYRSIGQGHINPVSFALSPDERTLAIAYTVSEKDNPQAPHVAVIDLEDGALRDVASAHACIALEFARRGRNLACNAADGSIQLYRVPLAAGQRIAPKKPLSTAELFTSAMRSGATAPENRSIAFSTDDRFIAAAMPAHDVEIVDLRNGKRIQVLAGNTAPVAAIAFSADGKELVSAGWDSKVRRWQIGTSKLVFELELPRPLSDVVLSSDGALVAARSEERTAVYELATGRRIAEIAQGAASRLAISADLRRIAFASRHRVRLFEMVGGQEIEVRAAHPDGVAAVAVAPDGTGIASVDARGRLVLWTRETRSAIGAVQGRVAAGAVAFSPDGVRVAFGREILNTRLADRPIPLRASRGDVYQALAYTSDGVIALSLEGVLVRFTSAGEETGRVAAFEDGAAPASAALSKDGKLLAVAGDTSIILRDPDTKTRAREIPMQAAANTVQGLAFSPDGSRLAAVTGAGKLSVYGVSNLERQCEQDLAGGASSVAFFPDGKLIAVGRRDGTIVVWPGC